MQDASSAQGCLACDLTWGRADLPGGRIYATDHWVVEHCIGPLGVGTLILKPVRHRLHMWELTSEEAEELGPLLRRLTGVIQALAKPDQVYVCLWSHKDWQPGHIHFVLQPVGDAMREEHAAPGAFLQSDMFIADQAPPRAEVETFAAAARAILKT